MFRSWLLVRLGLGAQPADDRMTEWLVPHVGLPSEPGLEAAVTADIALAALDAQRHGSRPPARSLCVVAAIMTSAGWLFSLAWSPAMRYSH